MNTEKLVQEMEVHLLRKGKGKIVSINGSVGKIISNTDYGFTIDFEEVNITSVDQYGNSILLTMDLEVDFFVIQTTMGFLAVAVRPTDPNPKTDIVEIVDIGGGTLKNNGTPLTFRQNYITEMGIAPDTEVEYCLNPDGIAICVNPAP